MNIDKAFASVQVAAEKEKVALALLDKFERRARAMEYANRIRGSVLRARVGLAQARNEVAYARYSRAAKALRQEPDPRISDMKLS